MTLSVQALECAGAASTPYKLIYKVCNCTVGTEHKLRFNLVVTLNK